MPASMRGPFTLTLFVAPQQRIITIGDFARRPYSLRVNFVEGYMTSHADRVCFAGRPTPDNVAMNIAPAIAQFHPGVDPATGILIPASEPSRPGHSKCRS